MTDGGLISTLDKDATKSALMDMLEAGGLNCNNRENFKYPSDETEDCKDCIGYSKEGCLFPMLGISTVFVKDDNFFYLKEG